MLREVFGPGGGVRGGFRNLRIEELHVIYLSLNLFRVFKSMRIRWVGHVACLGKKYACRVLVWRPEGRRYLEDLGIGGRIMLNCVTKKWLGGCGLDLSGPGWVL